MNQVQKILGSVLLSTMALSAQAASLSLVFKGGNTVNEGMIIAGVGDTLTFDIIMDFSDEPTIGGGFDIVFDSSILAFEDFTNFELGEDGFGRDPDVSDGLLESWAFGAFNGLSGPDAVGSVSFNYLGGPMTDILLTSTAGVGGPFVSFAFPSLPIDVDFNGATIGLPVPAAVWFLLSGIGALFGVRGRGASS